MSVAHPMSAVLTLSSGPNRNGPGCSARIRAILATPQPSNLKLLDKLIAEQKQFNDREAVIKSAAGELAFVVAALKAKAGTEEWSDRKLASKVGLPRTTWQRIERAAVNPAEWLPKLREACARLHLTTRK